MKLVGMSSKRYVVQQIDHHEFEIVDDHLNPQVNMHKITYIFGEFGYYKIPYFHDLAACKVRNMNQYTLCSSVVTFWLPSYVIESNFLVCHVSKWKTSKGFIDRIILPPQIVRQISHHQTMKFIIPP